MPNLQNSSCPVCFSDEHFQGECQEGETEEVQALNFTPQQQPWSGQKGQQSSFQQGQHSSFKPRVPYQQGYQGRPSQVQQPYQQPYQQLYQQPYQHLQESFQQGKVSNFQSGKMQELEEQNKQLEMRIKMMEAQQRMMLESQERTNKFLENLQQGQRQNDFGGGGGIGTQSQQMWAGSRSGQNRGDPGPSTAHNSTNP